MIFAAFEMKCKKHPNYTGQREPRTKVYCYACQAIYTVREAVYAFARPYTIQHAPMFKKRVKDV